MVHDVMAVSQNRGDTAAKRAMALEEFSVSDAHGFCIGIVRPDMKRRGGQPVWGYEHVEGHLAFRTRSDGQHVDLQDVCLCNGVTRGRLREALTPRARLFRVSSGLTTVSTPIDSDQMIKDFCDCDHGRMLRTEDLVVVSLDSSRLPALLALADHFMLDGERVRLITPTREASGFQIFDHFTNAILLYRRRIGVLPLLPDGYTTQVVGMAAAIYLSRCTDEAFGDGRPEPYMLGLIFMIAKTGDNG